jgi:FAD/FMN-containing dehydrogenase
MSNIKALISAVRQILPETLIRTDAESLAFYGKDWLKDFTPNPSIVVLPETIEQVQAIVTLCNTHGTPIVPSGGRTGLSGGATATNGEVLLSLERMRKILEVNRTDRTIRCQAGVSLEQLQSAAAAEGLYFPVDFSSRGSAQIGGNIATNAGGIRVIKYGNFRESVLGLTVVTGRGEVLQLNGPLFKNNSGYDLRNLFIGSEGTLGIIVEAILRVTTPPNDVVRILCGLADTAAVLPLLTFCRDTFRDLSAFEFMERLPFQEVIQRRGLRDPLSQAYECYALIECEVTSASSKDDILNSFGQAYENNLIQDVVVSESSAQAQELMNLRDLISEILSTHYTLHKNDISVPVSTIPEFLTTLHTTIRDTYPTFRVAVFGHVGDGNLHVNVLKPSDMSDADFWRACHEADHTIFRTVQSFRGSISAEHGVGLLKRDFIQYTRTPEELASMRGIKAVFDPKGIMNPGKVLPAA